MTQKNSPREAGDFTRANSNSNDAYDFTPSLPGNQYGSAMAGDVLAPMVADLAIVHLAADAVAWGVPLSPTDRERVVLAVSRVRTALSVLDGRAAP